MKRNLLLALAIFAFSCVHANAAVTVEQLSEPDYLVNNGYSEATAEEVMIIKNRTNGKPAEPLYESHNKFVRFWRNTWGYFIDPAQDTDERIHHNIHMSSSPKDY